MALKINRTIPTGYCFIDIMLGENVRNENGELIDICRGWELNTQGTISALQSAGKTTWIMDAVTYALKLGYPLWRIIVFDTDGNVYKKNRIKKLTMLSDEEIDKYIEVHDTNSIEQIVKILEERQKEYLSEKFKPVEYYDPIKQEQCKMMPYVIILVDTVTSLKAEAYDVDGKKDILANETDLTTFRLTANLANSVQNFFDKNNVCIWAAHLKANQPKMNQTIAEKSYKSSPGSKTDHVNQRIKKKQGWALWMEAKDAENTESSSHPIQLYGLDYLDSSSVFATDFYTVKSRTGTENRTRATNIFIDGAFEREASMVATITNLRLVEKSGQYPSSDTPHIFKNQPDCEYENKAMGQKRKEGFMVPGYDRPTNVVEARLLLKYDGPNEFLIQKQRELYMAMVMLIEDKLKGELETNNVSKSDMETASRSVNKMMGFLRSIDRAHIRKPLDATTKFEPLPVTNEAEEVI